MFKNIAIKYSSMLFILVVIASVLALGVSLALAADRGPWAVGVAYAVNDTVTYNGIVYKCLQAHTSQIDWTPDVTPALWQNMGAPTGGGGPTATRTNTPSGPTPTRTNTPVGPTPTKTNTSSGPTNTPTRTPTRTNTPPGPTPTTGGINNGPGLPAHVFAPYVDIMAWPTYSIVNAANSTGHKYYTLAFIVDGGSCTPKWGGITPLGDLFYASEVNGIRAMGGDVIVSFGGAAGVELGQACSTVSALQAAYQAVVTTYKVKWVDFDIEGAAVADTASIDRRNKAIKGLEAANPGLKVSYTLPVMPTGLPQDELNLISNARTTNGTRVDVVNVMAMDYGPCNLDMGQSAISAGQNTHTQIGGNIGITPMTGTNDITCEVFSTSNASTLVSWAKNNSYVTWLAFWSMNRDSGFSYTNIFKSF